MNRLLSSNVFNLFKRRNCFIPPLRNASTAEFKQDLPPQGGYQPIEYKRVPAKQYLSGITWFVGYVIFTFTACYIWVVTSRERLNLGVEDDGTIIILQPMLMAERDRKYLRILRRNRELEEEIMKDVPGWEVGTYFGEPIYYTCKPDEWHDVTVEELFNHQKKSEYWNHINVNKNF